MDKSSDAFRTISEVAVDLDLPQHVLRFWETRFSQIKPLKRGGGRRYYRPDDVDLLKGIRHLLYGEGYTIKGVQRILKEQGVRFVMTLWQDGAPAIDAGLRARADDGPDDFDEASGHAGYIDVGYQDGDGDDQQGARRALEPIDLPVTPLKAGRVMERGSYATGQGAVSPLDRAREAAYGASRTVDLVPAATEDRFGDSESVSPQSIAQRFAPRTPEPARPPGSVEPVTNPVPRGRDVAPADWGNSARQPPFQPMIERFRSVASRLSPENGRASMPGAAMEEPASGQGLSRDDVRRLQSTLFELLECKRLLDQAR